MNFDFSAKDRESLLKYLLDRINSFYSGKTELSVTPDLDPEKIKGFIARSHFNGTMQLKEALEHVVEGLEKYSVQCTHSKYFGLFNPRANFAGILADLITASYNPQLAAWSHSPFANEVEAKLIQEFGLRFGYRDGNIDGVFAGGGAEANHTALLCALESAFPEYAGTGFVSFNKRPTLYCSAQAHHSVNKAAKMVGLGYNSVRAIPINEELIIDTALLEKAIREDISNNCTPFMLIGTAGTTGSGEIDNLPALKLIADKYKLWFHVDAAWGGAAVLSDRLRSLLDGIESSDSITFDAHKWMSVPMGTSLFITSHTEIIGLTFRIKTEYMPRDASRLEITDPYTHSMQWSRRFIGLRVYLSLLFYGWDGYKEVIDHQQKMGELLREKLLVSNWTITNKSPLPLVCFTDKEHIDNPDFTSALLQKILESGLSWISVYPVNDIPSFRVCITNYNTSEKDLDELISELNQYRKDFTERKQLSI